MSAKHLRGHLTKSRDGSWRWTVRDTRHNIIVAGDVCDSRALALNDVECAVVAARAWWYWGGDELL